jgi:hypothetical protein
MVTSVPWQLGSAELLEARREMAEPAVGAAGQAEEMAARPTPV